MPIDCDIRLLFWNLGCNNNPELVAECIAENDADIAVFAEWQDLDLGRLQRALPAGYKLHRPIAERAKVIAAAKDNLDIAIHREQSRYVIYEVRRGEDAIALAGVHLEDKWSHPGPYVRNATARELVGDLKAARSEFGCDDAVIIGDFNMEPYDETMLVPDVFNAVFFKDVIRRCKSRTWGGRSYERFYNPMLCNYSESRLQYGSFYSSNNDLEMYWHSLDQVLVTADLVDNVADIQYLRSIGDISLVSEVKPRKGISDHLPLFVGLVTLPKETQDGK